MKKCGRCLSMCLLALVLVSMGACQTGKIQTGHLEQPADPVEGEIAISARADNLRNEVAWITGTVFAIPIVPLTTEGEACEELMLGFKKAVEKAGYQTVMVDDASSAGDLPLLKVNVEKFNFKVYTWMAPMLIDWGKIDLVVSVVSPSGEVLWSKDYEHKCEADETDMDINNTIKEAFNPILNRLVEDISSDEFQAAVFGK